MAYQSKVNVLNSKEGYNKLSEKYINFHKHLDSFDNGLLNRFIARDLKGKKIMDIGAGDGRLFKFFKNNDFEEYFAFDIAEKLLKKHPNGKNIKKIIGNLNTKLNFENNYFDIIINFFVLEHLNNLELLFQEIYRILKLNGIRIIGHFIQRREIVFKDGEKKFKIKQYKRKKDNIINFAKNNFFNIYTHEVFEKGNLLGWIFILKK